MTNKEFCENHTAFYGEKIDNIKQLSMIKFTGEELKEYVEHHIKPNKEYIKHHIEPDEGLIDKYGRTHTFESIVGLDVDLRTLKEDESVVYGDGETYYWKLTKMKPFYCLNQNIKGDKHACKEQCMMCCK